MKTKIETLFFMPNRTQIKEMVYQNQCKLVNNTRQGFNMQSLLLDHTVQGEFKNIRQFVEKSFSIILFLDQANRLVTHCRRAGENPI
jgi:hypothetical protein